MNFNSKVFAERLTSIIEENSETTRSIAEKLQMSHSTINRYCNGLMTPKVPTIVSLANLFNVNFDWLIGDSDKKYIENKTIAIKIPVLGYVRAGIPTEAIENIIDYEEIDAKMASKGEYLALQIKGDSMEPRIKEGDVVIVKKQETIENGEIAVVLVNGDDATVKKVYRTEFGIKLIAFNQSYDPLFYTIEEVENLPVKIIGRVVELRAKFD